MLIDTMFARDMYQVYEINDDWLISMHHPIMHHCDPIEHFTPPETAMTKVVSDLLTNVDSGFPSLLWSLDIIIIIIIFIRTSSTAAFESILWITND